MKRSFSAMALAGALLCAAATALGQTKVACIGDSITYGLGLSDRTSSAYPARLQALLEKSAPGEYTVRNFGNSGRGVYLS